MPVRNFIVTRLTEDVIGAQVWNGLTGTCQSMPTEEYWDTKEAADVLYERIVDDVDWSRVLLEASSRHFELKRAGTHKPERYANFEEVCGDCVKEAALSSEHSPRWDAEPTPRVDKGQDWLAVLAAARERWKR